MPPGSTYSSAVPEVRVNSYVNERPFSYRALFAVVYTTSVSAVYFALGVVAHRAEGLTPVVFLAGGIFFQLSAMTYAEGASLHPERGGSAVFGRYAFNELISFIAGWAIVLDYTILLAVTALTVPSYLAAFWAPIGHGGVKITIAFAVIAFVAFDNLTGVKVRPLRRRVAITIADLILQAAVIVLGLALAFHPHHLTETVNLPTAPTWSDLAFAFPIGVIAFTGLEAAASLAGEVTATLRQVRRLVVPGSATDHADLRRHYRRRDRRASGPQRSHRARSGAHQRAGAGRGRGVPARLGRGRAQVRGRDRGRPGTDRRRRVLDAGRLPCGLLARH